MRQSGSRGRVERRLLRYSSAARKFVALAVLIGAAAAACVILQAALVASIVAGAVVGHRSLGDLGGALEALAAVVMVGRAALAWAAERAAHRASAAAQSDLAGPSWPGRRTGPGRAPGLDRLPFDGREGW